MLRLAAIGYYTPLEAAECLDIQVRTLYNWISADKMPEPDFKHSRLMLWKKSTIHKKCKSIGKPLFGGRDG